MCTARFDDLPDLRFPSYAPPQTFVCIAFTIILDIVWISVHGNYLRDYGGIPPEMLFVIATIVGTDTQQQQPGRGLQTRGELPVSQQERLETPVMSASVSSAAFSLRHKMVRSSNGSKMKSVCDADTDTQQAEQREERELDDLSPIGGRMRTKQLTFAPSCPEASPTTATQGNRALVEPRWTPTEDRCICSARTAGRPKRLLLRGTALQGSAQNAPREGDGDDNSGSCSGSYSDGCGRRAECASAPTLLRQGGSSSGKSDGGSSSGNKGSGSSCGRGGGSSVENGNSVGGSGSGGFSSSSSGSSRASGNKVRERMRGIGRDGDCNGDGGDRDDSGNRGVVSSASSSASASNRSGGGGVAMRGGQGLAGRRPNNPNRSLQRRCGSTSGG